MKKLTGLLLITAVAIHLTGCIRVRPITPMPDGNKDRMKKEIFSGTQTDPKYWISKVTVTDTSFGTPSFVFAFEGLQSATKVGYFEFTRDKLKFHNAVNRQFLEPEAIANQGTPELINEWSITHSEYRLAEVDGYTTNREEENKFISWDEKTWFTVDWSKADISERNTFPYISSAEKFSCARKIASHVIDSSRKTTEDYITWTVAVIYDQDPLCSSLKRQSEGNFVNTIHYTYSFKRVPDPREQDETYTPYIYAGEQDPLLKKYGFFRTVRPAIAEDRRDKNIFYMNRWNPNKKHVFYFTEDYPDKYKDIAHGVICHTNKLLAKHKLSDYPLDGKCRSDGSALPAEGETCSTGICFELRENSGQKFGDIRYSFFHVMQTSLPVLGYGPSDAHPATGEIISGNVIATTHYLDYYLKYLIQEPYKRDSKEYIDEDGQPVKDNKTKYDTGSLFVKMKQTLKENDPAKWTSTAKLIDAKSEIRADFEWLLTNLTFGHPAFSRFTDFPVLSEKAENLTNLRQMNKIVPQFRKTSSQTTSLISSGQLSAAPSRLFGGGGARSGFYFNVDLPELNSFGLRSLEEEMKTIISRSHEDALKRLSHERNTVIYPADPVIARLPKLLANGMTPEEVKRRILFNLLSHEFGHVLSLRHNFYGSFDSSHWHGEDEAGQLKTSSVMDYMHIKEALGPPKALFGPYDEAALVYAYSGGEKDLSKMKGTHFLFCTDHHAFSNALCNQWDQGDTPSRVMMSLIESYEERYFIGNLRLDRAYWNTNFYPVATFRTMWDIKRMLMMWRTAFHHTYIDEILTESKKSYTDDEIRLISNQTQKDIRQALKLSMAFYNSVIQQSQADRDWQTIYNEESGSIEKIGISWDKLFAMFFLMGDDSFLYNPNHYLGKASYLTYINGLGFRQMIEEIMENTLTVRVDMEPWFIDFARLLYAKNASNYYNLAINDTGALLEKIGVRCYTPKGLKDHFGIDPTAHKAHEHNAEDFLDTAVISMEDHIGAITDTYYRDTNEKLAVTYFDGNYYTASSNLNKYSFTIIDSLRRVTHSAGDSLRLGKQDVYDTFFLYNYFKKNGVIPQTCNDGA